MLELPCLLIPDPPHAACTLYALCVDCRRFVRCLACVAACSSGGRVLLLLAHKLWVCAVCQLNHRAWYVGHVLCRVSRRVDFHPMSPQPPCMLSA